MKADIDGLVARIAPDPGPGMTPGGRELLDEITAVRAEPVAGTSSWRRLRVALPVTAALAAVVLAVTWALPGDSRSLGLGAGPAAALDVTTKGGYYLVTVEDMYADPARYQAQLRRLGLDITLELVPATPAMWGTAVGPGPIGGGITTIEGTGDCLRRDPCTIGLKVPRDFRGQATIRLARKARPGEKYVLIAPIDAPGEPLHCTGYAGKTVDEVRALLRVRGVTNVRFATAEGAREQVPGSWIAHDGVMSAPDAALLLVGPTQDRPGAPGPVSSPGPCRPS
ncbi:hypothetical protein [Microbispora sp. ATCC PTA-5024]|uniref:hypothetical protein n=1 Tax=Microbispora sp. ATCC PTA-5024 TaxID=316330 RepID=UPI0003DB9E9C|nr:hypothetical protein [Microbispora sp. ATCC PTA-5024]ETK31105.1 hypothetical protein MPTA5024_36890 [Microbispora sp. ATCC PTA-5024]